jgi:ABC-2 type transport system ATP-binding protein
MITVKNLTKNFTYYNKNQGLKASFKNLFYREELTKEAVKGISFHIEEGEFVGFLGPNGAGKTTTLKMLSGIIHPTKGEATVGGYVPWQRKNDFKKSFSLVSGQKNQLWWDLPANESLYLNKCIYEIEDKAYNNTLEELTELLDVKELLGIQVRRLSLGERMKMELIAALLHKPKVIFLDEPTIGLDMISQKKIRDFLKSYNKEQKITVVLTSHYLSDIEELCRRTIVINNGGIVYDGELSKVSEKVNRVKRIKISFSQAVERRILESYGDIKEFEGFTALLEVDKEKVKKHSIELLNTLPVIDFNIEDVPIEESMALLYETGGKKHESLC